ncbi:hypothetical protein ENBRE01_2577, partial [Enteropsectra breve]
MKLCYVLARLVAASFKPLEFSIPYAKELSSAAVCKGMDIDIFMASEVYSYEELKSKIIVDGADRSDSPNQRDNNSPNHSLNQSESMSYGDRLRLLDEASERLKLLYVFVDHYHLVLNEHSYRPFVHPTDHSETLGGLMALDIVQSISNNDIPKIELDIKYDIKRMNLVYQMRHQLFFSYDEKMTPGDFLAIFKYYEEVDFEENSVTDIFIHDHLDRKMHMKIKCDIVFGLNLYHMLKKQKLLKDFKNILYDKPQRRLFCGPAFKHNAFASAFDSDFFKRLGFIKQLFRVISVNYHSQDKTFTVDFIKVLKNMKYAEQFDGMVALQTKTDDKSNLPIQFLHMINEENKIVKSINRLEVTVPEDIEDNLDVKICAVLNIFPHIKELCLINSSSSKYNRRFKDDSTHFDRLIYTLLLKNKETVSKLSGFEIVGYNKLNMRTVMLIKQNKFERLGLRGIFSNADPVYLFLILRRESNATFEEFLRSLESKEERDFSQDIGQYSNLSRSLKHLIGNEEIIRLATEHHLAKNIQIASAMLELCNRNYELYDDEQRVSETLEEFKKNNTNKVTLITLKVIPSNYLKGFVIPTKRKRNNSSPTVYFNEVQIDSYVHSVTKLIVCNSVFYTREIKAMEAIRSLAVAERTLEITVTKADTYSISTFLKNLAALEFTGKNLVINVSVFNFIDKDENGAFANINDKMLEMIHRIHQEYIQIYDVQNNEIQNNDVQNNEIQNNDAQNHDVQNHQGKRLYVHFYSLSPVLCSSLFLENQIYEYILDKDLYLAEKSEESQRVGEGIVVELVWDCYTNQKSSVPHCVMYFGDDRSRGAYN